jgi:hypothetical protein
LLKTKRAKDKILGIKDLQVAVYQVCSNKRVKTDAFPGIIDFRYLYMSGLIISL